MEKKSKSIENKNSTAELNMSTATVINNKSGQFDPSTGRIIIKPRAIVVYGDENHNNFTASVYPKAKKYYQPPRDRNGKLQHWLSPKEKEWVERSTGLKIDNDFLKEYLLRMDSDGRVLDKSDPYDYIDYKFILTLFPYFATEKNYNSFTSFIISDEEAESKNNISKRDLLYECLTLINEKMDEVDKAGFLRLFGMSTEHLSPRRIKDLLGEFAEKDPGNFISMYKDENRNTKVFIESLLHAHIISKRNRAYYYNEEMLGGDLLSCIEWINDLNNSDTVLHMKKMLGQIMQIK